MIYFDEIIKSLQGNGGVSVYFENIVSRMSHQNISYEVVSAPRGAMKWLSRYRRCHVQKKNSSSSKVLFHSSYYRLPSDSSMSVVTTVHDFTYELMVPGLKRWIHSWQKNKAIRNSDIVICVSQNTANDLMHYCPIDPNRIRVIHNGVAEAYFPLPDTDGKFLSKNVLFVGARGGYKNFNLAVEAVSAIADLELHIVGGGALSKQECKQLDLFLPGRYRWLGSLSDKELNFAYNSAYALLYTSSYEGFGIPVIEAMRAGCPVIAVNASSIPEVAGDAALLVEHASSELFSVALQRVSALRDELRQAGFKQAEKFSWERCFNETLAVYKELL